MTGLAPFEISDLKDPGVHCAFPPKGLMAPFVGRRYDAGDLMTADEDAADLMAEACEAAGTTLEAQLQLVRAWEVPGLMGQQLRIIGEGDLPWVLTTLLRELMPGFDWNAHLEDKPPDPTSTAWSGPLRKYLLMHNSIPAPRDEWTQQPMALELVGRLVEVEGLALDSKMGQRWMRHREELLSVPGRKGGLPALPVGEMIIEIQQATYANVMFPGVGVPFYM